MALKINTNIKNDADGYLLDASSVRGGYVVVSGEGLDTKENIPVAVVIWIKMLCMSKTIKLKNMNQ